MRTRAQTIASPVKRDGAFAHPLALLHKNTHIYTYKYSHIYTYVQIFTLTYYLTCIVTLLFVSWRFHDISLELEAYDLLGLEYYYLNDVQKARYFQFEF